MSGGSARLTRVARGCAGRARGPGALGAGGAGPAGRSARLGPRRHLRHGTLRYDTLCCVVLLSS